MASSIQTQTNVKEQWRSYGCVGHRFRHKVSPSFSITYSRYWLQYLSCSGAAWATSVQPTYSKWEWAGIQQSIFFSNKAIISVIDFVWRKWAVFSGITLLVTKSFRLSGLNFVTCSGISMYRNYKMLEFFWTSRMKVSWMWWANIYGSYGNTASLVVVLGEW